MQESTELKQTDLSVPIPRTLGTFGMIITFLAFSAGSIRNEPALILVGAVFLAVLGYCFITTLLLSVIHQKRIRTISVRILTKQISAGNCAFTLDRDAERNRNFFRLPGIILRYEIRLATKDGRHVRHLFDPDFLQTETFVIPERGAYYTRYDEFAICDVPGFFRLAFHIPQDKSPRVLVTPKILEATIPITIRSGGTVQRSEPRFLRTDNLTDHRPYIPGDDPRRINWKLYGHLGDLFVREGEPEPPPHSRLLILVDTQGDPALYTAEAGRRGADMLCENALALALEYMERGMDISIGYICGGITQGDLAGSLAYPAFLSVSAQEELPYSPEDQGILILALPRAAAEGTALDRFLKKRGSNQTVDIVFLYEGNLDGAAETCVGIYGQKTGVYARNQRYSR